MSPGALHPGRLAASVAILAGLAVVFRPEHALTIAQVAAVALAAGVGLHALLASVPEWSSGPGWLLSPFDHGIRPPRRTRIRSEIERIRWGMGRPRRRIAPGLWLTPQTFRLLRSAIEARLGPHPADPETPSTNRARRREPSPLVRAILEAEPGVRPPWYRTRPPNPRQVAAVVHQVLDEVRSLDSEPPSRG